MERKGRNVQSVERAMFLLETLGAQAGGARLTDLVAESGLSKSTAHGMLDTLVALGYVTREGARYALGPRMRQLSGRPSETTDRLREAFLPALKAFAEICGERCFLAVPGGTDAYVTLAALEGNGRSLSLPLDTRRDAMTTSAVGKVLLAHDRSLVRRLRRSGRATAELEDELGQIPGQGYAMDLQASLPNLNCVALPLRFRGQVVAALGAGGPTDRLDQPVMRRLAGRAMRELFDLIKC